MPPNISPLNPTGMNRPSHRFGLSFIGAIVIALVVWLTYTPAFDIGFWMDDLINIDNAGRLSGLAYWQKFFDPTMQRLWYRPMVGVQWSITYALWGGNPTGYHILQVIYHIGVCLLLYWLITRLSNNWLIGFIAAILYATLPLYSMAVYWPSVHDPLMGIFFLSTMIFWLNYLRSKNWSMFLLAHLTLILTLLSKEIGVVLPAMLWLLDFGINSKASWRNRVVPYILMAFITLGYAAIELIVISRSLFTQQIGYSVGINIFPVFLKYLPMLTFPWGGEDLPIYLLGAGIVLVGVYHAVTKRDRRWLLLGAGIILPTLIVSPIPLNLINSRYLYLPLMITGIIYALGVAGLITLTRQRWSWVRVGLGLIVTLVIVSGSIRITDLTNNHGGFIRTLRLQFRPIYQQHPSYPPDTLLYFIDTPLQTLDISGLMFLRYGSNVIVNGVDQDSFSNLRNHQSASIWYLDDQKTFKEQPVSQKSTATMAPDLPAKFTNSITLQTAQVANQTVKHEQTIIVLLSWQTSEKISTDYTVFAHLVDAQGQTVIGTDNQPRKGNSPTSTWQPNRSVIDWIILPVTEDISSGQHYHLEIGMYDPTTMERLSLLNASGEPFTDHFTIGDFNIAD